MSDPVTNIEIEDVLSSIRRLVSDEARAQERDEKELSFSSDTPPQAVELEEENQETGEEKPEPVVQMAAPALVLTPALRIEPEAEKEPETEASEDAAETQSQDQSSPALILTQDDAAENNYDISSEDASEQSDTVEAHEEEQTAQDEVAQVAEHEEHAHNEAYSEPETSTNVEMDDVPQAEVDFSESEEETDFAFHAHRESEDGVQGEEHDEAQVDESNDDEPLSIEDKIAALEALISRSDSDFEPDGAETGGNAGRPGQSLPWEESQEPRVGLQSKTLPDPEEASQSAAFSDGAAAFQRAHIEAVDSAKAELEANASETLLENDELSSVLDEEALRDMVAEIVRQELQGPLGERITRNVRKLVRREIYRALAANELD